MRVPAIIFALSLSLACTAQEWDLFPFDQRSYYMVGEGTGDHALGMLVMDSIQEAEGREVLLFRSKLPMDHVGTCRGQVQMQLGDQLQYLPQFTLDSLVRRQDTVFFHSPGAPAPLILLPKARPGDTWSVNNTYPLISAQFTCTTVEEVMVFGVMDSVKTFEIVVDDGHWNTIPLTVTMQLSRKFGLLRSIPFVSYLGTFYWASMASQIHLVGVDGPSGTFGTAIPRTPNYFHPSVGDVLFWRVDGDPGWWDQPDWVEFHLDTITHVAMYEDSLTYDIRRTSQWQNGLTTGPYARHAVIHYNRMAPLVEAHPGWITGVPKPTNDPPSTAELWRRTSTMINTNYAGDTTFQVTVGTDGLRIDTVTCDLYEAFDFGLEMTFDTRMGLIRHVTWNNPSVTTVTLAAFVKDGVQSGNIPMGLEGSKTSAPEVLVIPNPAKDRIHLTNVGQQGIASYRILSTTGQVLQHGSMMNGTIDIHTLPTGLHVLQLERPDGTVSVRFLKE